MKCANCIFFNENICYKKGTRVYFNNNICEDFVKENDVNEVSLDL